MSSQREILEDAIIETIGSKLLQERNPTAGYLGLIGSYNGELQGDDGLEDFRRRIRGQFPAILVAASDAPLVSESVTRRQFRREIQVEIYSASNNLRSREHRLRNDPQLELGATRDPGVFQMVEHVHSLISGNDFGIAGIGPGNPLREEPIIQITEFTIWRQIIEFKTDAHVEPWDAGDGQSLTAYFLGSHEMDTESGDLTDVSPNPLLESEGTIPE